MPQLQVLPPNPGFGQQLGQALGGGVSQGLSQSIAQHFENKQKQQQMSQLMTALGISPSPGGQQPTQPGQTKTQEALGQQPERQGQQDGIPKLSEGQFLAGSLIASKIDPSIVPVLGKVYESQQLPIKEGIKAETKRSSEFLSGVDKLREGLPTKELAMKQIVDAVANRTNLESLGDQLFELTKKEFFRSNKGAQLASATKEFFLGDLSRIAARPNMFLEKALSSAFTDPAKTKGANEIVAAGMQANMDLDRTKVDLTSKFEDQYKRSAGYIPARISKDVDEALKPIAKQIQDNWALKVRQIEESYMTPAELSKLKKVPEGTPLTEKMANILFDKYETPERVGKAAKQLGFTIPGE